MSEIKWKRASGTDGTGTWIATVDGVTVGTVIERVSDVSGWLCYDYSAGEMTGTRVSLYWAQAAVSEIVGAAEQKS